mgnify:CR=1 FL=1
MSGTPTNRTNIALPSEVSNEIIQKTQEGSVIMQLARKVNLPGRGIEIPIITADPAPAWVGETEAKPVSNPTLNKKTMRGYKLAVIVPFSNEFKRDMASLYDVLVSRLPAVLGEKFDNTVFGGTQAPGDSFDSLGDVTAHSLASDVYQGLLDADTQIALNGGINTDYVISPQAKGILLGEKDDNGRPLFINSVAEGAIPMILGVPTKTTKAAYITGSPKTVGFAGQWDKAWYGIVDGLTIDISTEATLDLGGGSVINLFQQNMFAVRAEIEVGFVADKDVFAKLTASTVPSF